MSIRGWFVWEELMTTDKTSAARFYGRVAGLKTQAAPFDPKYTTFLGSAGSIPLCLNGSAKVSNCSSSLRYKTSLHPFTGGLNLINRLHPITFKWKADQSPDLGLGAEDVAAVEPLLVTHNANGEVEGVKYDRLSAVFINAFKEQQNQIERLQAEVAELKKRVGSSRRQARVRR